MLPITGKKSRQWKPHPGRRAIPNARLINPEAVIPQPVILVKTKYYN